MSDSSFKSLLDNSKYYYVDTSSFHLYEITNEGSKNCGHLLEKSEFLNPVIMKLYHREPEFLREMYSDENSEKIVYIVNYNEEEKFFVSFESSKIDSYALINNIELIEASFLKKFQNLKAQSIRDPSLLPSFSLPSIQIHVTDNPEELMIKEINILEVKLSKVPSTPLKTLNFSLGKFDYVFDCIQTDKTLKLSFKSLKEFQSWKKLNLAIKLKHDKS